MTNDMRAFHVLTMIAIPSKLPQLLNVGCGRRRKSERFALEHSPRGVRIPGYARRKDHSFET